MREYFFIKFIINEQNLYTLWYTDDTDGVISENSKVICFGNLNDAKKYAENMQFYMTDYDISVYNLDIISKWTRKPTSDIDCKIFLDWWNMFDDLSKSIGISYTGNFDVRDTVNIYNKLFYGSNVSAVRGDGEVYMPVWTKEELEQLKNILENGISLLKNLRKH